MSLREERHCGEGVEAAGADTGLVGLDRASATVFSALGTCIISLVKSARCKPGVSAA